MKHFILLTLVFCGLTMFFSCHKEDNPIPVIDSDGNIYHVIKIGNQYWMQENLRSRHYSNGEIIPDIICPNNDYDLVEKNGFLYTWNAVMHGEESSESNPSGVQGICPKGWHVPSHAEWTELTDYVSQQPEHLCLGLPKDHAKALASTEDWEHSDYSECSIGNHPEKNNTTGFNIRPAGYGYLNADAAGYKQAAFYWTCTEFFNEQYPSSNGKVARARELDYYGISVYNREEGKNRCFSVRCVKD